MFSDAMQALIEKLEGWGEGLILMLPNFVVAVLVVMAFWILARIVYRMLQSVMQRTASNIQIARLLGTLAYIGVLLTGLFIALGILELEKTVFSLLAGVGILGLALGFAFQDLAENFVAGILMAIRQPFSVGEVIGTQDFTGRVKEINLRSTILETPQGQFVHIPNSEVFGGAVVNYTAPGRRRVDLGVGVSYGDDLEKARETTLRAVEEVTPRDSSREVEFFYEEFGGSSINFVVRFWLETGEPKEYATARSDAIVRIHRAFDEAGLTIPFPIRTLDFGIVGGKDLSESLAEVPSSE